MKHLSNVELAALLKLSSYTDVNSHPGVAAGLLGFDTSGNVITTAAPTINTFTSQVKHQVKLGENMTAGTPVYVPITQDAGTVMTVLKASNAGESTSSKTMGLIETGGVTGDLVYVITEGLLTGLNTSTASKGDPVWLGPTGTLIFGLTNKPSAPNHLVFLGIVTRSQQNNGEIFVKVQNGFEVDELHDVAISSPKTDGQGLFLQTLAGVQLWRNRSIADVLGYTPANDSNVVHTTGTETINGAKTFNSAITVSGEIRVTNGGVTGATGVGYFVLNNASGNNNTAFGYSALSGGSSGNRNTGIGSTALVALTTGFDNTAVGNGAGRDITTGSYNTLVGGYIGTAGLTSNVILSDGQGNIRFQWDGTNIKLNGNIVGSNAYTSTPYLPLAGGTLTGTLNGTVLNFSQSTLSTTIYGYNAKVGGSGIEGGAANGRALYLSNNSTTYPLMELVALGVTKFIKATNNSSTEVFSVNTAGDLVIAGTLGNGTYTYTLPSSTGTLALTSALSSYLPLTGGTLTGSLVINPANTGVVGLDVASNTITLRSDSTNPFPRQLTTTMGSGTLVKMQAAGYGAAYVTDLGFYTSSNSGANSTPNIYLTGGDNRVGINTTTPGYTLDVSGDINTTGTFRVNGTAISSGTTLNGTGFVKASGTTITYDNSTYLTTSSASSTYVPYTGATGGVNLGGNNITAAYAILTGVGTNQAGVLSLLKGTSRTVQGNGYTNIYAEDGKIGFLDWITANVRTIEFSLANISSGSTRVFTLPNTSGTLALTADLSSYLTLAGGTLTGALSGTSGSFSSNVSATYFTATAGQGYNGNLNFNYNNANTSSFGYWGGGTNTVFLVTSTGAATFSSSVTASSFSGAGTGLTGTASSLTAGAVSSITANTGLMTDRLTPSGFIDGLTTTNFRSTLFGTTTTAAAIATARWNTTPSVLSGLGLYSTMIAWGASDTQGFLAVDYNGANARIGGGNGNNINWTSVLLHSSNYTSYAPSLTGSGASGTWGINVTGTAGSETLATVAGRGAVTSTGVTFNGGITISDGNVEMYKFQSVDMSNTGVYSTSNYYPVLIPVGTEGTYIQIQNNLSTNVPSWATHGSGFTLNLRWLTNGSGWGTTAVKRKVFQWHERFNNARICGGITQMGNSSQEVVWLRGGGRYSFFFSRNTTAYPQSGSYTANFETVSPTSSVVNDVWNAASGTEIYYASTVYADSLYTGYGNGYHVSMKPTTGATFNIGSSTGNRGITGPFVNATYDGTANTTSVPIFFNCESFHVFCNYDQKMRIEATYGDMHLRGYIYQGNTNWSDLRMKQNLQKITDPLTKISAINGYTFEWREWTGYRNTPEIMERINDAGLIAQEVEAVLPAIVETDTRRDQKSMNYNGIIALHTEGIKELIAQNQALQARVTELENRLV